MTTIAQHRSRTAGFFLPNGVEFVLTLFGAAVALALTGPGAFSLDAVIARRRDDGTEPCARTEEGYPDGS